MSQDGWLKTKKPVSPEDNLFKWAFLSFIPGIHIFVLIRSLHIRMAKRGFQPKVWFALGLGGFFSIVYLLLFLAIAIIKTPREDNNYQFLDTADPRLSPVTAMMKEGNFYEAYSLFNTIIGPSDSSWTVLCTLGIITSHAKRSDIALTVYRKALNQNPNHGEFYYFYGRALLIAGYDQLALEQFKKAQEIDPNMSSAANYAGFIQNRYEPSRPVQIIFYIVILLFLLTLHEYGHAWSANQLGDDTAKSMGRVTLNPLPHIDFIGTILLPGILLIQGAQFLFGWAKPVPVIPSRLRHPIEDDITVSFAGPAMNFLVAMSGFIVLMLIGMMIRFVHPTALAQGFSLFSSDISIAGSGMDGWLITVVAFIKTMMVTSLVLGIFNLIPIPPLDGSHILSNLLPANARMKYEMIRPYSMFIFIILVITRITNIILWVFMIPFMIFTSLCFSAIGFA